MLRLLWARNHLKQAVVLLEHPNPALHLHDLRHHLQQSTRHLFPLLSPEAQQAQLFRPWGPWSLILFHFKLGHVRALVLEAEVLLQGKPSAGQVLEAYQSMQQVHLTVGQHLAELGDVELS
ncbi:hypothetical protein [Deinococcus cellulosilyticus]|uniref:Uncharacterized protein n=1 Tax=Deinococcus cellulosilyticus (strain DSM 18568 / NBRC 106333 / KACC 11606 / 5516J-15) TaxID=1223518 RepID=A0A511MYN0_DEIC1|nr:hypothetical protein [Deinococcus cellulosilyticus]GEM45705.1 hypothetical protein DC3_13400 [Deinococcus cellulosilyticus NBRC 106333 = KACC 11606]